MKIGSAGKADEETYLEHCMAAVLGKTICRSETKKKNKKNENTDTLQIVSLFTIYCECIHSFGYNIRSNSFDVIAGSMITYSPEIIFFIGTFTQKYVGNNDVMKCFEPASITGTACIPGCVRFRYKPKGCGNILRSTQHKTTFPPLIFPLFIIYTRTSAPTLTPAAFYPPVCVLKDCSINAEFCEGWILLFLLLCSAAAASGINRLYTNMHGINNTRLLAI